jgi:formylglycine-generating enzyme required for sulfatase activity
MPTEVDTGRSFVGPNLLAVGWDTEQPSIAGPRGFADGRIGNMTGMKTYCCLLLALLAGVSSVPAQITNLGIAPAGGQSIIYWPANIPANYVLQTTTNLASTNWVSVTNAVPVTAVAVTTSAGASFFRLVQNNGAGMVLIPAGPFTMGDSLDASANATPTFTIIVSGYYMDTNLVSFGQWGKVYNWAITNGYGFDNPGAGKSTNQPVVSISWYDCVKWCNARSQQAGLPPVYFTDTNLTQIYTNGDIDAVYPSWSASGYRLPTEAEWEKAARGGLVGQRFPWGNTISENQANYIGDTADYSYDLGPNGNNAIGSIGGSNPGTSPVGSFPPNAYGLFDMAGNVFEWCWDWYGTPYGQPTATNPTGPATGMYRILRGGSWLDNAGNLRCGSRGATSPNANPDFTGFRCVKRVDSY